MSLEVRLDNITSKLKSFDAETSRLEGQRSVLHEQIEDAKMKCGDLEVTRDLDEKAIEVLLLVQKSTREKIKEAFENMVTFALHSIYQEDYQFRLEFSTRGNLGELDFLLKTPENKDPWIKRLYRRGKLRHHISCIALRTHTGYSPES